MWLRRLRRKLTFFWQRRTRGWDDSDLWNLDYTVAKFVLPRLRVYRRCWSGLPDMMLLSDYPGISEDDLEDKWNEVLDDMIYAMEVLVNWDSFEFEVDMTTEAREAHRERVDRGLYLFGRYLRALWD